jgi:hypothetical protein
MIMSGEVGLLPDCMKEPAFQLQIAFGQQIVLKTAEETRVSLWNRVAANH